MLRGLTAAAAAALVLGLAGQAGAAVWTTTFTGTVLPGSLNQQNMFGHTGGNLDGLSFKLVFTTTLPNANATLVDDPANEYSVVYGAYSPGLTVADLTIDGSTVRLEGSASSLVDQLHAPDQHLDAIDFAVDDSHREGPVSIGRLINVSILGDGFLTSYQWQSLSGVLPLNAQSVTDSSALFAFSTYDPGCHCDPVVTTGQLDITSAFAAAVPEPDAWALMLAGMAGAGTMLRRRRATLA